MHKQILEALYQRKNCVTEEQKRAYLRSLIPATKQLWKSYRTATGAAVNVDYGSEETQASYLLRYYPDYTPLLYGVLRRLDQDNQYAPCTRSSGRRRRRG
jgi:hypothetical protein